MTLTRRVGVELRDAGPTATISSGSTPAVVNRLAAMRGWARATAT
jgi:hypothetical protein